MKAKLFGIASVALVSVLTVGLFSACDNGEEPIESGYAYTVSIEENPYVDMTIEELAALGTRDELRAKEDNDEIAYFFEGQYVEGFGEDLGTSYHDFYLCKDGFMYGISTGVYNSLVRENMNHFIYGYWYNIDETGESRFTIHITGYYVDKLVEASDRWGSQKPLEPSEEGYRDIDVYDSLHTDYILEVGMSYPFRIHGAWMGDSPIWTIMYRNITVYGNTYEDAKVSSLTVDESKLPKFKVGDEFNLGDEELFTATHVSGKVEPIHSERIRFSAVDMSTPGTKTVTGKFLGATVTFNVTVEES